MESINNSWMSYKSTMRWRLWGKSNILRNRKRKTSQRRREAGSVAFLVRQTTRPLTLLKRMKIQSTPNIYQLAKWAISWTKWMHQTFRESKSRAFQGMIITRIDPLRIQMITCILKIRIWCPIQQEISFHTITQIQLWIKILKILQWRTSQWMEWIIWIVPLMI